MLRLRLRSIVIGAAIAGSILLLFNHGSIEGMEDLTEISMLEDYTPEAANKDYVGQQEEEELLYDQPSYIEEEEDPDLEAYLSDLEREELEHSLEELDEENNYKLHLRYSFSQLQDFDEENEAVHMIVPKDTYEFEVPYHADIPKLIWQTSKDPFDREVMKYTRFWRINHPSYSHAVLDDEQSKALVISSFGDSSVSKISQAYTMMPLPVLKADFFRYLVLLAKGGIYSDIDTAPLKHINNWIPREYRKRNIRLIVGIEADPDRPDWNDYYARRVQFCQWTIAAAPGHPILWELVRRITDETWKLHDSKKLSKNGESVMEWTGPGIWTDAIMDYLNWQYGPFSVENITNLEEPYLVGDVLILPITAFSPGVGHMGSKSPNDPMAYVQHFFAGSWKDD